jgi:uncharacterized ferritin-like protein (DUF455 family)
VNSRASLSLPADPTDAQAAGGPARCPRYAALQMLGVRDPQHKCAQVIGFPLIQGQFDADAVFPEPPDLPGRPERPLLVPPNQVRQRSVHTQSGRAILVHSLAHIELNAVNLALDVIWRFPGLPTSFYTDWWSVAREEAHHFGLLRQHLASLGHQYGDFPAHQGLWEMAQKTREDLLARLALVPRILEARGLDMSPLIRDKLMQAGDSAGAAILDVILRDEIGHVAIGNRWYRWICAQRGLDSLQAFDDLALHYRAPVQRGPFNLDARRAAGFDEAELRQLMATQPKAGTGP